MKLKRKKKGSTFLIVIITMFLIFITGTSILATTANGYKMRKNENERLKNLYEADSGLNGVENIIIKTSEQAINYADNAVKKQILILKDTKNINELFKEKFYEYLTKEVDYNYEDNNKIETIKYLIINKKYIDKNEDGSIIYKNSEIEEDIQIYIPKDRYEFSKDGISMEVQSTFESKEENIKNKKTVSITYKIKSPEYSTEISNVAIYTVFDNKALTVDGDLNINSGETSIIGDIWVKGKDPSKNSEQYIFDKYNRGINLENTKFNINGNVYTANTFHLKNKIENGSAVNGNIYAKNVYIGKENNSTTSSYNNISFEKDVIVNNDLALNATNSNIIIKGNFYGINEKTVDEIANSSTDNSLTVRRILNSSSIIVNDTSKTSTITVENKSYIMGVAYLNATDDHGNKYQTGESLAVKGNYLSYTDVGDIANGEDNFILKYYNPLQLLESKNGESNAAMKANYFSSYYSNSNNYYYDKFNDGGVRLIGEIESVGASIKDGKVQGATIKIEDSSIVTEQRDEFARNVFAMGDITGLNENLYDSQVVERTVNNQIDFEKVEEINSKFNVGNEGTVILIGDNTKLIIDGEKIEGTNTTITKGLIITNGDIEIKGKFDFTGNIITTGNVTIEGKSIITYDSKVIRNIIGENEDLLNGIFETKESIKKSEETKITPSSNIYGVDTFLNKSSWKIVK